MLAEKYEWQVKQARAATRRRIAKNRSCWRLWTIRLPVSFWISGTRRRGWDASPVWIDTAAESTTDLSPQLLLYTRYSARKRCNFYWFLKIFEPLFQHIYMLRKYCNSLFKGERTTHTFAHCFLISSTVEDQCFPEIKIILKHFFQYVEMFNRNSLTSISNVSCKCTTRLVAPWIWIIF